MKKIYILLLSVLCLGVFKEANAINLNFTKNPQTEIRNLLKDHNRAIQEHKLKDIKIYYDKNYKSADGFNFDDLTAMLEKTHSAYGNIKYKTKINNITAFDNWALAQMSDKSIAKIYTDKKKTKEKMGILEGTSSYVVYLKNTPEGWNSKKNRYGFGYSCFC